MLAFLCVYVGQSKVGALLGRRRGRGGLESCIESWRACWATYCAAAWHVCVRGCMAAQGPARAGRGRGPGGGPHVRASGAGALLLLPPPRPKGA